MSERHVQKIPVLAYHSHRVEGNTYETNDHIALHHDLRTIHTQGFHIVPLLWVAEWIIGRRDESTLQRAVALSFDDGADFDFYDLDYPHYGPQRSFYNLLRDFQAEFGSSAQLHLHASSFVIASPTAREEIAARDFARFRMTDGWWKEAHESGILSIYNHSWDHNHPEARRVCEEHQIKGSFEVIDTYDECRAEVQYAAEYIQQKIHPAWPVLFAYPWGQSSAYIRDTYFPDFQAQHRTLAAFGPEGSYVRQASPRWNVPRFVCGSPLGGWQSTEGLIRILQGCR